VAHCGAFGSVIIANMGYLVLWLSQEKAVLKLKIELTLKFLKLGGYIDRIGG
jgi:hypothetical protein